MLDGRRNHILTKAVDNPIKIITKAPENRIYDEILPNGFDSILFTKGMFDLNAAVVHKKY